MILVISPKNTYAARRLKFEARIMNYKIEVLDVADLVSKKFDFEINQYRALYVRNPYFKTSPKYIPQIISLAKKFKKAGKKVVDANIAKGDLGKGKWEDYKALKRAGVLIPGTRLLKSYPLSVKRYPLILKWIYGMKAKGTFLINSQMSSFRQGLGGQVNIKYQNIITQHPKDEWMLQEYIEGDCEYKVMTVGFKALPVVLRFDYNKKVGRVKFEKYQRIIHIATVIELKEVAEKASKILGRELAKVDILQKGDKLYVLEVNRFPGLKSFEELTKFNVSKEFVKYLQK